MKVFQSVLLPLVLGALMVFISCEKNEHTIPDTRQHFFSLVTPDYNQLVDNLPQDVELSVKTRLVAERKIIVQTTEKVILPHWQNYLSPDRVSEWQNTYGFPQWAATTAQAGASHHRYFTPILEPTTNQITALLVTNLKDETVYSQALLEREDILNLPPGSSEIKALANGETFVIGDVQISPNLIFVGASHKTPLHKCDETVETIPVGDCQVVFTTTNDCAGIPNGTAVDIVCDSDDSSPGGPPSNPCPPNCVYDENVPACICSFPPSPGSGTGNNSPCPTGCTTLPNGYCDCPNGCPPQCLDNIDGSCDCG